jgi:hypothetical protein
VLGRIALEIVAALSRIRGSLFHICRDEKTAKARRREKSKGSRQIVVKPTMKFRLFARKVGSSQELSLRCGGRAGAGQFRGRWSTKSWLGASTTRKRRILSMFHARSSLLWAVMSFLGSRQVRGGNQND